MKFPLKNFVPDQKVFNGTDVSLILIILALLYLREQEVSGNCVYFCNYVCNFNGAQLKCLFISTK